MTSSKKNGCKKSTNIKLKSQCISWKTINPHYIPNRMIRNECNKELKKKESCKQTIESPAEQENQPNADKWSKDTAPQPVEREDGELSGEEAELAPICRFYWSNNCTWGSDCRFRHPGSTGLGNYKMFESIRLPTCTNMNDRMDNLPPVVNWGQETEMKRSMDSFGRIRLQAIPKVDSELAPREDKELMEYNDLDTDPYYTHQEPTELIDSERSPVASRGYPPVPMGWPGRNMWGWPVRRSSSRCSCCSSSSSDYSSTTNSTSSSSPASLFAVNPLKRKLRDRRPSSSSTSDSDSSSSSYSSSTHTSEQSSSTSDVESIQNYPNSMRMRGEPPLKRRKTLQSVARRI